MPLTVKELRERLDSEGVSPSVYSIGEPLNLESYCIVETSSGWQVFYYERGIKNDLTLFSTFTDGSEHFLNLVLGDPTTRHEQSAARSPTRNPKKAVSRE
jgi:hypothetical protein